MADAALYLFTAAEPMPRAGDVTELVSIVGAEVGIAVLGTGTIRGAEGGAMTK